MFGRTLTLFEIFGFKININLSWAFIAVLIAWSLALGFFPRLYEGLPTTTYWWMGIAGVIGLFFSIVLHELAHSLVARAFGTPMKGITLFLFGGIAEMEHEPPTPKAEFLMAIAGPLMSVMLGGLFYGLAVLVRELGGGAPLHGVLRYLAMLNGLLVAFNMVPAFPLDGGRALRAGLWAWRKDLRWATRIASRIGAAFGAALMILGVIAMLRGDLITGLWWLLIGMFIRAAAQGAYHQLQLRRALEGEPVSRFMTRDPIVVSPEVNLSELVEDYVYRHYHDLYPVISNGELLGCIGVREIKQVPRERWADVTAGDAMTTCSEANVISQDADAMQALAKMQTTGSSRLMVADGDRLIGIIALKDLLGLLSLKIDLEDG
jgi:Zn-dependent protease/CBS domain-containing protein